MATTILSSLIVILHRICVIIVAACLLPRSRFFTKVPEGRFPVNLQVIIILGALSVDGTAAGSGVNGASITVRDPGPLSAGLQRDLTVCSCSLATNLASPLGGCSGLPGRRGWIQK